MKRAHGGGHLSDACIRDVLSMLAAHLLSDPFLHCDPVVRDHVARASVSVWTRSAGFSSATLNDCSSTSVPALPAATSASIGSQSAGSELAANSATYTRNQIVSTFGVDALRANYLNVFLCGLHSVGYQLLPLSPVPHVSNEDIATLGSSLCDQIITSYFNLVSQTPANNGRFVCLDALHTEAMKDPAVASGTSEQYQGTQCCNWSKRLRWSHLRRKAIVIPAHLPAHWILYLVQRHSKTTRGVIWVCDPLGSTYAALASRDAIAGRINSWLRQERQRFATRNNIALEVVESYEIRRADADLACQIDPASGRCGDACGAFVCCYFFWLVYQGRMPTKEEIPAACHVALRLAILDAILTGSLRSPLSGPMQPAPAAAGDGEGIIADDAVLWDEAAKEFVLRTRAEIAASSLTIESITD